MMPLLYAWQGWRILLVWKRRMVSIYIVIALRILRALW